MTIQLIVDCYGIDSEDGHLAGKTDAEISALRKAIDEHLARQDTSLLRIRLPNGAIFKHFSYLEGLNQVLPTQHLIPRVLLVERLKIELPDWLTDELIVALGLLKNATIMPETKTSPFEAQLLMACHADLLKGKDFYAFEAALRQQPPVFLALLAIEAIRAQLILYLTVGLLINPEAAALFIDQLSKSTVIDSFLQKFAYQQHVQFLRQKLTDYSLTFALPAQVLPASLLTALPILSLLEVDAKQLPGYFLSIIEAVTRKILVKELEPLTLADFVIVDWVSIWGELDRLCEDYPKLITPALACQCQCFESIEALALGKKFTDYLASSHYRSLLADASVDEVLDWSVGYFDYLRSALLSKQVPDESINGSFTNWLLAQSSRISRSEADWRYCAKQIEKFLSSNYVVVVIVVDALSALNQDILLTELATLSHQLTISSDVLFAPLPTLTEIGKLAVLTGKQTHSLPNGHEKALQQTYQRYLSEPNTLKIIKSWEEIPNEDITEQNNLVVFFENRIDDRLHEATSFTKHRDDIVPIVRQLKRRIQSWLKDVARRDVVFFITADHGMTVTNGCYTGESLGEVKDRIFKMQVNEPLPDNFVSVNQDSAAYYAIPKTRLGLSDTSLAHGGLTPEEVLIPFVTLTRATTQIVRPPIDVEIIGECVCLGDRFWQVDLRLSASVQVESLRLSLGLQFVLEFREPIDIIRANKSHNITLKFRSHCVQEGLTAVDLELQYDRADAHEKNIKRLEICFPISLLERDTQTQNFEDMF